MSFSILLNVKAGSPCCRLVCTIFSFPHCRFFYSCCDPDVEPVPEKFVACRCLTPLSSLFTLGTLSRSGEIAFVGCGGPIGACGFLGFANNSFRFPLCPPNLAFLPICVQPPIEASLSFCVSGALFFTVSCPHPPSPSEPLCNPWHESA